MGSGTKHADYASHREQDSNGVGIVTFSYDVEDDDLDMDGIGIPADALRLGEATLTDPQGQAVHR